MYSIGIFSTDTTERTLEYCKKLKQYFPENEYRFFIYLHSSNENQKVSYDSDFETFDSLEQLITPLLIISIGGDGTFLKASHFIAKSNIPIVGINLGRMGFLADISKEEIEHFANQIIARNYTIEERPFIELLSSNNLFGSENLALNEISIIKKDSTHLITIHTWIDDEFLNSFWADGIMVSTPTGSTAYSLSLGGPILVPKTKNFILNTIAPHSLTVRPIIFPDSSIITLQVEGRDDKYNISLDSKTESFDSSTIFKIKKSNTNIKMVKIHGSSYFKTLRNKLMWGIDIRN